MIFVKVYLVRASFVDKDLHNVTKVPFTKKIYLKFNKTKGPPDTNLSRAHYKLTSDLVIGTYTCIQAR